MLANAIGSMASILNRFLGYAGFYLLNAAFEGASALANMLLAEPIVTESQASREKHPLHALPEQFRPAGAGQPCMSCAPAQWR